MQWYCDTINRAYPMGKSSNVIVRREFEPLLLKAYETLNSYKQAMGVPVFVLDQSGRLINKDYAEKALAPCGFCKKYSGEGLPCTQMHIKGIIEARRRGAYIYMCDLGLVFWTSPFFSNGRFCGAAIAGGVLGIGRDKTVKKITILSGGTISDEEGKTLLADIPEKQYEEIKALARILLVCAEQISRGKEDYNDAILRRSNLSNQINLIKLEHGRTKPTPGYSLDQERMLLAALRRGDNDTARHILNGMLENIFLSSPDNFKFIQFRAIELVVLFSRAAVTPDTTENSAVLEANNRYLKRIQETENIAELTDALHIIIERMAGQIFSFQGIRHASALRKAERFIWENYTRKISLQEIAGASGLSAPYFSTIFKEEMGENLSNYLNRLRVEKASVMLRETGLPLNEISGACGFEDQSWFSKIFKSHTGISPGKYREQGGISDTGDRSVKTGTES